MFIGNLTLDKNDNNKSTSSEKSGRGENGRVVWATYF